jgi:MFS family permease
LHNTPEVKHSLRVCVKEGVAAQVMAGIFDYYLVPLAIFLNASAQQIGSLISVPHLLASFCQLFAVQWIAFAGGRKALLTKGCFIQAVFLIPISILPFYDFPGRMYVLLGLIVIFRVVGSILGPAWGSMVSSYLTEEHRGSYFGKRMQIINIAELISLGFWGLFLTWMNKSSIAMGFFFVFLSAAVVRFISFFYMRQMVELPVAPQAKEDRFTFWMFIRRFRESNFVKFILYTAAVTFSTQLAGPFFSVYMLKELNFSYASYMAVSLVFVFTGLLTFPIWGRHADVVGNAKILKLSGFMIAVAPLLWPFAHNPWQMLFVEAFNGLAWGGFNLCCANFIYDAVSPSKRVQCLGYFNLTSGLAIFFGATLGGFLATRLPYTNGSQLVTLFLLSSALRFSAYFFLSKHFNEVRSSFKPVRSFKLFFSVVGLRPILGRNID